MGPVNSSLMGKKWEKLNKKMKKKKIEEKIEVVKKLRSQCLIKQYFLNSWHMVGKIGEIGQQDLKMAYI